MKFNHLLRAGTVACEGSIFVQDAHRELAPDERNSLLFTELRFGPEAFPGIGFSDDRQESSTW